MEATNQHIDPRGLPCPTEIAKLLGVTDSPVDISVSSKGFLRADLSDIYVSDNDMPRSQCLSFCAGMVPIMEEQYRMKLRVYETKRGLRIIGMSRVPCPQKNLAMLYSSGNDRNYVRVLQECNTYSCRLTAKPIRLGLTLGAKGWMRLHEKKLNQKLIDFFQEYAELNSKYATCSYMYGGASNDPEISRFLEFHDRVCKANENLPLA